MRAGGGLGTPGIGRLNVTPPAHKELIERLPRTFRVALNDQLRSWQLLFPAEQRLLNAQLDWLSRLPPDDFKRLLAPMADLESKMELPRWDTAGASFSVQDAGLLARSPLYPQWRSEVEKVFGRIDQEVEKSGLLPRVPRLLICALPPGLPLSTQALWPQLEKQGTWVPLNGPFRQFLSPLTASLAGRTLPPGREEIEGTWIFECLPVLARQVEAPRATVLCWTDLAAARREFLSRLNRIRRDLRSVDQTNEELKRMDISRLVGRPAEHAPRVREFVRALFLSGNGSLVFNNSFVQWGASEALRRVQPQVLLACFGIREKLKPFSSMVLFEDQTRSNPTPDEDDPAGSLVDGLMLAEYAYLAAQRLANHEEVPLAILAAGDLDRILVLGPRAPQPAAERLTVAELTAFARRWLAT